MASKYEVRELKNLIENGRPIGMFLVLSDQKYVATVEFDYFSLAAAPIDEPPLGEDIASEVPEACEAVAKHVATDIMKNNKYCVPSEQAPPAPTQEDLNRIFG